MSAERDPRATRLPSLLRGLLLAVFAGLGALPFQLVFGAPYGNEPSIAVYQLGITVLAVIACAPSLRTAFTGGALAALLCGGLAIFATGAGTATLGALCALGLARSAVCWPRPFARALAFELALALPAALAFALLYDGRVLGNAFAVWAFWLVQSAFALLPGDARKREPAAQDRFTAAAAAADRLMQRSS